MFDPGPWLVGRRGLMDTNESAWRVVVHDAFAAGEISYSATRAITSLDDVSTEVDAALVELARSAPIGDVEAAVRYYQGLASQESKEPYRRPERREVRIWKGHHGLGQLRANLTNDELAQLEALLAAFMAPPDESAMADSNGAGGQAGGPFDDEPAGDSVKAEVQSAAADSEGIGDWRVRYGQTRADALMDGVAVAMAHMGEGHASGADRYLGLHLVAEVADSSGLPGGPAELVDGSPLDKEVAARIACDASFITHLIRAGGEPLYLGRKVRDWTTAQRRAITVRDRGRCRFPGCTRGITDIHHVLEWEEGGLTDVNNGAMLCGRHHSLVHQGYRAVGDANGELSFHRPDGTVLGLSTAPVSRPALFRAAAA
ncbi:MAG: HNH endonuclease signature motif containing protein [Acidimicrobiales bacterium]